MLSILPMALLFVGRENTVQGCPYDILYVRYYHDLHLVGETRQAQLDRFTESRAQSIPTALTPSQFESRSSTLATSSFLRPALTSSTLRAPSSHRIVS